MQSHTLTSEESRDCATQACKDPTPERDGITRTETGGDATGYDECVERPRPLTPGPCIPAIALMSFPRT